LLTPDHTRRQRFETLLLPHLSAAYNLARWLVHRDADAQDIVQEAFLRAFRYFESFRGGNERAWLLGIVRNTCYDWFKQHRQHDSHTAFDEELHGHLQAQGQTTPNDPETLMTQRDDALQLNQALRQLPLEFREVVVLRDLEELSYKEIAALIDIPLGTVMSRLSRGRKLLSAHLQPQPGELCHEV
jgi:RNA polymerase sigma factor (sigma-70 family)